jgi:hypothetical protein
MTGNYLIFSVEHGAWWGPSRCGYVASIGDAGRYSDAEAMAICTELIPGTARRLGALPALPVSETHVMWLHQRFRSMLPDVPPEPWEPREREAAGA